MFKNYLKIAFRNIWKNKAFSALNIIGLASGLAVCLLIVLYVKDELSYDKYNVNAERIYRIDADLYFNGTKLTAATVPEPLAPTLLKDYPQVEAMVRLINEGAISIKKGDQNIQDHRAVFADSTFFKVFTVQMTAGTPSTALKDPNSIIIDETTAKKYFNSTDVLGKTLYVNNTTNCKVTGVIKDFPERSHFHFSFIRPLADSYRGNADEWLSNNAHSYILVKPGVTRAFMQTRLNETIRKYLYAQLQTELHTSPEDMESHGNYFRYHLMPLTNIHLHSNKSYEFESNGNVSYVYIFSLIAFFILLIACVNFMNLSTARSANRAKEVGIRKVAGSTRSHLITQFLTESVLLSFFSLLAAIALSALLLPLFNQLSGKEMQVSTLFSTWLFPVMIGLMFIVGCIAGSYPAFYLSSFQPIKVLKGNIAKGFKNSWLGGSLVVFQFSISIILIIGTIVIYKQLDYIQNRKIGYNREQVLVLHNTNWLGKQAKSFREDVLKIPELENATISGDLPTSEADGFNQNGWFLDATLNASKAIIMTSFRVDENYIPTLGMKMVNGRNFSQKYLSDSTGLILNEAALKLVGFKDPLKATIYNQDANNKPLAFHIIGVVKDFNYSSMHNKVAPLIMQLGNNPSSIALRINTKNIPSTINKIKDDWKIMAPGQPFNYTFMDADFNNAYKAEQRTGKLFITFALFAIFIACLGLFGLVTYAAEQRTKEIGVRKVLGASVSGIVAMLSKNFAKLVLIASVIAFPIAWWTMNKWLQSFAYRIHISWWVFVIAGIATILIALITVSFQAIKAAFANPVKSLRSE
ncbi:MAG: ABC transporter permease [Bacteroidota bacterium]|nr:ABC transporter permease [Bacteroidota bacterium]